MKKLIAIAAVILGFTSATTFAQNLSASANASANMVAALNVSHTSLADMNFGTIYTPSAASTLVLSPAAAAILTPSSGLQIVSSSAGTAAKFTVSAGAGSPKVSWTAGPITLNGPSSSSMSLSALTCSNGAQGAALTLSGGTADVYIGGTLNIAAGQLVGTYTNTGGIIVTVAY
jgi:hypothetical protein